MRFVAVTVRGYEISKMLQFRRSGIFMGVESGVSTRATTRGGREVVVSRLEE